MAEGERRLWDELHCVHLNLADTSDTINNANLAYTSELQRRLNEIENIAALDVASRETPLESRVLRLHSRRRLLGIIFQEQELLLMDEAQSRAIGEDAAFIALGQRPV
jgi:hypothetical protein